MFLINELAGPTGDQSRQLEQRLVTDSKLNSQPSIRARVLRSLTSLMALRGLNLLVPVISLPYIVRVVGMDNYGHITLSLAIATFMGSIIEYGFSITAVKEIATVRADKQKVAEVFWRNFFASLVVGAWVSVVFMSMMVSTPFMREMSAVYVGALLLAAGNALFPHWLFLGMERTHYVVICTTLTRVFYLVLLVIFVRSPEDYILINLLGAGTAWINIVFALYVIFNSFGLQVPNIAGISVITTIRNGFHSFLLQWTPNLYNSASIMILGFSVSPASLGAFNAANAVATLFISVGRLLANSFLPVLSMGFEQHRIFSMILLVVGVVSAVFLFVFAPFLAILLSGEGQEIITRDLRYISLSVPFVFGYFAYGLNYAALTEGRRQAGFFSVCISIVGLALALVLVPMLGAAGVAAVLLFARIGMFAMSYRIYWMRNEPS